MEMRISIERPRSASSGLSRNSASMSSDSRGGLAVAFDFPERVGKGSSATGTRRLRCWARSYSRRFSASESTSCARSPV